MKTLDAIEHFKWRFTKSGMNVSKKDISSLNTLIIALNEALDVNNSDNQHFYKLFIYFFRNMILTNAINNNYKEVDLKIIVEKLRSVLNIDINSHIEMLHNELTSIEIQNLIDKENLTAKTISELPTKDQTNKNIRKLLMQFKDEYRFN